MLSPAAPPLPGAGFDLSSLDLVATFLQGKRSEGTRRAYHTDFRGFFGDAYTSQAVSEFLLWPPPHIAAALQVHKNKMLEAKLSEASINRRLSAVRSLLKFAFRMGAASCDGSNLIDGERVQSYRDTTGISVEQVKRLLAAPARRAGLKTVDQNSPVLVLRDTALLTLFCMNGLRCNEVRSAEASDFNMFDRKLQVLGKGRGSQRQAISLNLSATMAIEMYLRQAGHRDGALFRNLHHDPATRGQRLSNRAIYKIIHGYGVEIGCPNLHPHALRHTAITQVLVKNKGNVIAAMEFSRHLDPKILLRYFHNSQDLQGEMSDLLGNLFAEAEKPKRKK